MRPTAHAMLGLAIPCLGNVALWFALFGNPGLGFRDDLTPLFVAGFLVGLGAAAAGTIVFIASGRPKPNWGFLCFFVGVILLNVFGFFWSLGATVRAFS
jgi:hypothetical protein